MVQSLKTCRLCKEEKTLDKFDRNKVTRRTQRHICKLCRSRKKYINNPRIGIPQKDYRLLYKYGITHDQYLAMSEAQNHLCKACRKTNKNHWGTQLVVDHCHATGKVRGLLCDKCNKALGQVNDEIEVLEALIQYLKDSQSS